MNEFEGVWTKNNNIGFPTFTPAPSTKYNMIN